MTAAIPQRTEAGRDRLPTLDFLRFVAAAMVVLFHYTFRAAADGKYSSVSFPELDNWTRYGFLGVDLFFIISGFVILLTVDAGQGRPGHFVASRISRLFPAFWAAATLTFIVCLRTDPPFVVSPQDYLLNLGMLPSWLGAEYVDGVYWTLETELYFYLLVVGFLLVFWERVRLEWLLLAWLLVTSLLAFTELGPSRARTLLMVEAAPFFIAGCMFYRIWRDGWTRLRVGILVGAWVGAAAAATRNSETVAIPDGTPISPLISAGIVTIGFVLFVVFCVRPNWLRLGGRRATLLGALTYPLYLVHQKLGYLVINAVEPIGGRWVALALAIATALIVAYLIHRLVELRFNTRFRRWLEPRTGVLDRLATSTRGSWLRLRRRQA